MGMTRAEKVAEAARLRGEGLTVTAIAERFGVSPSCVTKWLNPERYREKVRRDNARRGPAKRQWERENATPCVDCGEQTSKPGHERCVACHKERLNADARARCERYIQLRREGLTNPEIAEREGVPVYTVAVALSNARHRHGLDVPAVKMGRPPKRVAA